ncbi:hypothetical protein [Streptomyces sp. NBC_00829]|uniref:hypothetical protein n=1 Tax=Streptomyces sp. NBC_00829 TaxID=2903679 RepID=UPI00386B07D0|nr:hypothetical protein OG293_16675 [Streptomyces sp. NBC_00829]
MPAPAGARATGSIPTTTRLSTAYMTIRQPRCAGAEPGRTAPKTVKLSVQSAGRRIRGGLAVAGLALTLWQLTNP